MEYTLLNDATKNQILVEELFAAEVAHYKAVLACESGGGEPAENARLSAEQVMSTIQKKMEELSGDGDQ